MPPEAGSFDPVLLSQVRLGIVTALLGQEAATFPDLKALLGLTQGNLGIHLQKLEQAGYVEIEKGYENRRPRTTCRLTTAGRKAFLKHVARLAAIVRDAGGNGGS